MRRPSRVFPVNPFSALIKRESLPANKTDWVSFLSQLFVKRRHEGIRAEVDSRRESQTRPQRRLKPLLLYQDPGAAPFASTTITSAALMKGSPFTELKPRKRM